MDNQSEESLTAARIQEIMAEQQSEEISTPTPNATATATATPTPSPSSNATTVNNNRSMRKMNPNDPEYCSYSEMALHCQRVEAPWTTVTASATSRSGKGRDNPTEQQQSTTTDQQQQSKNDERGGDEMDGKDGGNLNKFKKTNLGDVIAEALSQKIAMKKSNDKSQIRGNGNGNGNGNQATTSMGGKGGQGGRKKNKRDKGVSIYLSGMQFNRNN